MAFLLASCVCVCFDFVSAVSPDCDPRDCLSREKGSSNFDVYCTTDFHKSFGVPDKRNPLLFWGTSIQFLTRICLSRKKKKNEQNIRCILKTFIRGSCARQK